MLSSELVVRRMLERKHDFGIVDDYSSDVICSTRDYQRVFIMKKLFWFISFILLVGLTVTIASAQDPQPQPAASGVTDDQVNVVAKQLYCPVCENVPLDVCPTQACAEWRELIRLKLAEGRSVEWIKEYFAQQYGDRVLAQPPARRP